MANCVNTSTGKAIPAQPKWQQITESVRRELAAGRPDARLQFYTVRELAAKYEVSALTAQRVFRELKALGLIESHGRRGTRVKRTVERQTVHVCLRDDQFASPGAMRNFQTINNFLDGVLAGEDGLFADRKPIGYSFLHRNPRAFAGQPLLVSANVFLDVDGKQAVLNRERLEHVVQTFQPIVFHGFTELPGVSQVICDLYHGIRQAVDHLADAGHADLGLLSGPLDHVWFRSRFQAFVDGLFDRDLRLLPERIKITSGSDRDADYQAVAEMLAMPHPPTALVCVNDSRALNVLEYCARHGVAVPGALEVTGFDNSPESALSRPALTTVDGRDFEAGRACASLLRRQLHGDLKTPQTVRIVPKLITRESSHG